MSLWSAVIESAPPPIWIDVPVSLHSGAKVLNVDKYFQGNRNTFKSMSLDQQRNECLHDLITFLVNLKNNLANDKDSKIDPEFILGHSHYKSTIAKNYLFW